MSNSERLIIPFKGLGEGKHEFKFVLTEKFFQVLDYSEFEKGNLSVNVYMDKKPTHMVFEIEIEGEVNVMCDRCLDFFNTDVEFSCSLIVKISGKDESDDESNEELLVLSPDEFEIDLSHYVYESICLSLPVQRVHPLNSKKQATCDKKMLKILKEHSASAVNTNDEIDPRWDKLKNININ